MRRVNAHPRLETGPPHQQPSQQHVESKASSIPEKPTTEKPTRSKRRCGGMHEYYTGKWPGSANIHAPAPDRAYDNAQPKSLLNNTAKSLTSQHHPVHAEQAQEGRKHVTLCVVSGCCIYWTEGTAGIAILEHCKKFM